jgi:hypothetical protein
MSANTPPQEVAANVRRIREEHLSEAFRAPQKRCRKSFASIRAR